MVQTCRSDEAISEYQAAIEAGDTLVKRGYGILLAEMGEFRELKPIFCRALLVGTQEPIWL